jgi:hypothetical protein
MVGVVLSYPDVSKQITDVGLQMSDVRRQKTDYRGQKTDERLKNWKMKHLVCPLFSVLRHLFTDT